MVTVCTVLQPRERSRVEAAGIGYFATFHLESLPDILTAARRRSVDAVLVSARCGDAGELWALARFHYEFPAVATVAFVSETDCPGADALVRLGASGVRRAVDCTLPTGLRRLRELLAGSTTAAATRILAPVLGALGDAGAAMRLFFETLVERAPALRTARALASYLGVPQGTLESRFCRARLPSPKTYLAHMRVLHAAHLFLNPGVSVQVVAERLNYASPQCFARHVRARWGVTPSAFRRCYPFDVALRRYLDDLITPYRATLRAFTPFTRDGGAKDPAPLALARAG